MICLQRICPFEDSSQPAQVVAQTSRLEKEAAMRVRGSDFELRTLPPARPGLEAEPRMA